MKKILIKIAIGGIAIIIILVLFIKLDTPAAAEFTDNYLRPILGNQIVIFLEKYYYNSTDRLQQLTEGHTNPADSGLLSQGNSTTIKGNALDLSPLQPLSSLLSMNGEGIWLNRPMKLFPGKEVMAYTFIRPDPNRSYALVTLLQVDSGVIGIGSVAGTKQPGGPIGHPGPGSIPEAIKSSGRLMAAFDGGFQYRDGQYGMMVDNTTYVPLKSDLGTIVGYKNGSAKIINYIGQNLGADVAFIRQNCPILVENGQIAALDPKNKKLWGRTPTTDIHTWRSGIGINKKGNLIYAVGNSLTATTLAQALKMAGAIRAIQLDINPYWVRFNIFDYNGQNYQTTTLNRHIQDGSKQFLSSYTKDFFYLYQK